MSNFDWIADNLPIISGVVVALLSALSSFVSFLRHRKSKSIRRIKEYADILPLLANESRAKQNINELLEQETKELLEQKNRKIDVASIICGALCSVHRHLFRTMLPPAVGLVRELHRFIIFSVHLFHALRRPCITVE